MSGTNEIVGIDPQSKRCLRVVVEEGIVSRIEPADNETDLYLSPGLVDLQVNGYAGLDLNTDDLSEDTVFGLVDVMVEQGVTCFAATLISASEEHLCGAFKVIAEARRSNPKIAACMPLIHVEGPHLSPLDGYRGAHSAASIRPPSIAEFDRWQVAADGAIGMVTLSPHFEDSATYISALVQRGVHVAIGHTHATPEQITIAADAGARLSTHLGNGIALEIPRHRNVIWRQLSDDRLTASFLADGHHLPSDVLQVMLRAKGVARSILVSDSVALAGMPAGIYDSRVGGRVELRPDGKLCIFGSDLLAGSTASLPQCVSRAVRMTGLPLCDALKMATENPGRFVRGRGRIAVGSRGDLIRFRWQGEIKVTDVWLGGEQVSMRRGADTTEGS